MKIKSAIVTIGIAGILAGGAAAQHEEHHPDQASPQSTSPMAGAMMQGGMKSQMPQMIIEQEEIGKLVNELMKSLAAIQNEKDSAALKKKLAQHDELLRSLQTKVQSQSRMMNMMQHMMSGSMMGRGGSSETKK